MLVVLEVLGTRFEGFEFDDPSRIFEKIKSSSIFVDDRYVMPSLVLSNTMSLLIRIFFFCGSYTLYSSLLSGWPS